MYFDCHAAHATTRHRQAGELRRSRTKVAPVATGQRQQHRLAVPFGGRDVRRQRRRLFEHVGGQGNRNINGASNIQPVHRQLKRPRRQIGVQSDACTTYDRDQWVTAARQLAQHTRNQRVDRRSRVVSQVSAGLPAALDDAGRRDTERSGMTFA